LAKPVKVQRVTLVCVGIRILRPCSGFSDFLAKSSRKIELRGMRGFDKKKEGGKGA